LEDSCESVGSTYDNTKTGCFGLMSSFSTYFGHHFSSIEGGFITTDDKDLYRILISLRSHGWDRDFDDDYKKEIRKQYNLSDFRALYTFYYPGFNLRSTDLQAFIAINQIDKLDEMNKIRNKNYLIYDDLIKNNYWKIKKYKNTFISNFAYPIIHPNINNIVKDLNNSNIECRPLVCGSIGRQPYWINLYGSINLEFADIVHNFGMYVPNNHQMKDEEIELISKIINKNT
jgi:CDP-6-deoxy-D-xylo-4-hexulose-3-dehydrase